MLGAIASRDPLPGVPGSSSASSSSTRDGETLAAVKVARSGAIGPLVALVVGGTDDGQIAAAGALAAIAACGAEQQMAIAGAGALTPLVTLLRSGSNKASMQAAAALASLTERPDSAPHILRAGGVAAFVRVARTGNADAQYYAALAIANLSSASGEAQVALAAAGAVPLLIAMLQGGKVQMPAAAALAKLAAGNAAVRGLIAREEGLAPLLALLNGVHVPAQVQAAAAIAELARDDPPSQVAVAKAGGIRPLVAMLQSRNVHAQSYGASALAQVAARNRANQDVVARVGGMQAALNLLPPGNESDVQSNASLAVAEMCRFHSANQSAIVSLGAVGQLVLLLRSPHDAVRAEAAGAVWALTEGHAANKVSFAAAGTVSLLVSLLEAGSARAQKHAAHALVSLAYENVANQGAITTQLVELLMRSPHDAQARAAAVLRRELEENPSSAHLIASSGRTQDLIELLKGTSSEASKYSLWALSLSIDSSNQAVVLSQGGVTPLVAAMVGALRGADVGGAGGSLAVPQAAHRAPSPDKAARPTAHAVTAAAAAATAATAATAAAAAATAATAATAAGTSAAHASAAGVPTAAAPDATAVAGAASSSASAAAVGAPKTAEEAAAVVAAAAATRVQLQSEEDGKTVQQAAAALALLANGSKEAQKAIAAAGGIEPLIEIGERTEPCARMRHARSFCGRGVCALYPACAGLRMLPLFRTCCPDAMLPTRCLHAAYMLPTCCCTVSSRLLRGMERSRSQLPFCRVFMRCPPPLHPPGRSRTLSHARRAVATEADSSMLARESAAAALSDLANIRTNREAIVSAGAILPLVRLLRDSSSGKRASAAALAHLSQGDVAPALIAQAGAINPLVDLLSGEYGEGAQEEGAHALFALADHAPNRVAITEAGGIGPLVVLLGSKKGLARDHAEAALVRLSIEQVGLPCSAGRLTTLHIRDHACFCSIAVTPACAPSPSQACACVHTHTTACGGRTSVRWPSRCVRRQTACESSRSSCRCSTAPKGVGHRRRRPRRWPSWHRTRWRIATRSWTRGVFGRSSACCTARAPWRRRTPSVPSPPSRREASRCRWRSPRRGGCR